MLVVGLRHRLGLQMYWNLLQQNARLVVVSVGMIPVVVAVVGTIVVVVVVGMIAVVVGMVDLVAVRIVLVLVVVSGTVSIFGKQLLRYLDYTVEPQLDSISHW